MARAKDSQAEILEASAVIAHRAYIESFSVWERAFEAAYCPAYEIEGASNQEHSYRCAQAEAEKERNRLVFRDLCDALGYVPIHYGITIPAAQSPLPGSSR